MPLMPFDLREETPRDHAAIRDLTRRAFAGKPYSAGDEQDMIDRLRACGALTLSLVAERAGVIVGHVAFSPATSQDGAVGWYALGPIAVDPALQRQGIGGGLIRAGLARLGAPQAQGCIVIGDTDYYIRHGFAVCPDLTPVGEPPAHFMIWSPSGHRPSGHFAFHPAFYETVPKS